VSDTRLSMHAAVRAAADVEERHAGKEEGGAALGGAAGVGGAVDAAEPGFVASVRGVCGRGWGWIEGVREGSIAGQ
jgi:hypothetical protein